LEILAKVTQDPVSAILIPVKVQAIIGKSADIVL
jgi:hypothetical protein